MEITITIPNDKTELVRNALIQELHRVIDPTEEIPEGATDKQIITAFFKRFIKKKVKEYQDTVAMQQIDTPEDDDIIT